MTHLRFFLSAAVAVAIGGDAAAGISPEELSEALGGPTEIAWSVTDADADAWTPVPAPALQLGPDLPAGSSHALEAIATGPGVLAVELKQKAGNFDWTVSVDGVVSGRTGSSTADWQAVQLGPGEHTIRWSAEPDGPSARALVSNASFRPFETLPLAVGGGGGIVLSSEGTVPWIGQDGIHAGDGAAAWSGIQVPAAGDYSGSPDGKLRTQVTGPGVFHFKSFSRGAGTPRFRIGLSHSRDLPRDSWHVTRIALPPGEHEVEWILEPWTHPSGRAPGEMAVDEVAVLPVLPVPEAIDTPGWDWQTEPALNGALPTGVADEEAIGGSAVVMPSRSAISTVLTTGGVLTFRATEASLSIRLDGQFLERVAVLDPLPSDSRWRTYGGVLPTGGTLRLGASDDLELDSIRLAGPPDSLSLALGMPDSVATVDQPELWETVPFAAAGRFGVGASLVPGLAEGWIESTVNDPGRLYFVTAMSGGSAEVEVSVNGSKAYVINSPYSTLTCMEVGGGEHRIRWRFRRTIHSAKAAEFRLAVIAAEMLEPGEGLVATLGLPGPFFSGSPWKVVEGGAPDGGPALRLGDSRNHVADDSLETVVTGPGLLGFSWFREKDDGSTAVSWSFDAIDWRDHRTVGWQSESVWFPEGTHRVRWNARANPAGRADELALGAISFESSASIPLGDALEAPDLVWETGPEKHWYGAVIDSAGNDAAVTPPMTADESSSLRTHVVGPGLLRYRMRQGSQNRQSYQLLVENTVLRESTPWNEEDVEVPVLVSGEVVIEWRASGTASDGPGWLELDAVEWLPNREVPLADALDAGPEIAWTAGGDRPFVGVEMDGAFGGSAAYAALEPGEEAWLEATVDGPGLFDFWLRPVPGAPPIHNPWNYWTVEIDGVKARLSGSSWPAQWITGEGPHRVRFTLKNPDHEWSEPIASAVDLVSWVPLEATPVSAAAGLANVEWTASSETAAHAFTSAGRTGGASIVVPQLTPDGGWLEAKLTGPGTLEWDSVSANASYGFARMGCTLVFDGVVERFIETEDWERVRLAVPEGEHTVRWLSHPDLEMDGESRDFGAVCMISDFAFTPGVAEVTATLGAPAAGILITGDEQGHAAQHDVGVPHWQLAEGNAVYLFHSGGSFFGSLQWGHPEETPRSVNAVARDGSTRWLSRNEPGWTNLAVNLLDGRSIRLHDEGGSGAVPAIRLLALEPVLGVPLADAAEAPGLTSDSWFGIASASASADGVDCAVSMPVSPEGATYAATLDVEGPCLLRFSWRKSGYGSLKLAVDGATISSASGEEWSSEVVAIPSGTHGVSWVHAPGWNEGEAYLDMVSTEPLPVSDLTAAAVLTAGYELSSEDGGWQVGHYLKEEAWEPAARCVGGSPVLTMQVTGPATVRFKGRCVMPMTAAGASSGRSVIDTEPRPQPAYSLSGYVDGEHRVDIVSGGWLGREIHVPAGEHVVSWRLTQRSGWLVVIGGAPSPSTLSGLQGWVEDIEVLSAPERYQDWTASLPEPLRAPHRDADGDGVTNLFEYAFGTDAADSNAAPASPQFVRHQGKLHLLIPRTVVPVRAILESSSDLETWQEDSRDYPVRSSNPFPLYIYPSSHRAEALPVEESPEPKFYRV